MFSVHLPNHNGFKAKVVQLKRGISTIELRWKLMKGCLGGRLEFEELQARLGYSSNRFHAPECLHFSRYITAPTKLTRLPFLFYDQRSERFVLLKMNRMQAKAWCVPCVAQIRLSKCLMQAYCVQPIGMHAVHHVWWRMVTRLRQQLLLDPKISAH